MSDTDRLENQVVDIDDNSASASGVEAVVEDALQAQPPWPANGDPWSLGRSASVQDPRPSRSSQSYSWHGDEWHSQWSEDEWANYRANQSWTGAVRQPKLEHERGGYRSSHDNPPNWDGRDPERLK